METTTTAPGPRFRGRSIVLLGILVIVVIGAFAYKRIFARPGEDALRMIPAGATLFASLDLSPSVTQVPIFKRIETAIERNHFDSKITDFVTSMLASEPIAKDIRPYFKRSLTFAIFDGPATASKAPPMVALMGISDHKAVEAILKQQATAHESNGLTYYTVGKSQLNVAAIDDQLAVSSDPATLAEVQQVADGKAESVMATGDYKAARTALDADCNLMFFMNPKLIDKIGSAFSPKTDSGVRTKVPSLDFKWIAYGFAVRDGGVAISMSQEFDGNSPLAALAKTPPLRKDLLATLPSGAYGVYSLSGGSDLIKLMESMFGKSSKEFSKAVDDARKSMEKSTGLDVDRDLVPALAGDCSIAVYPSSDTKVAPVELLASWDDSNGADPAASVPKIRMALEKTLDKDGHTPLFIEKTVNGVQISEFAPSALQSLGKNLRSAVKGISPSGAPGYGGVGMSKPDAQYMADVRKAFEDSQKRNPHPAAGQYKPDPQLDADMKAAMARSKARMSLPRASSPPAASEPPMPLGTVCYCVVGKSVFLASSEKLLLRAVATLSSHKDSLSTDPRVCF